MIGEVIKNLRKERGISQETLASNIGLPRYTISDWEQGRVEPNLYHLRLLSVYFNISADELLEIQTPLERKEVHIRINGDIKNSN